jgi:hypothetical protein
LPLYQGDALNAYLAFSAFDFIFPFVAALFLSVWWAFLLRINTWPIAATLRRLNMPLWVFATTLFDWLENVSILAVIAVSPEPPALLINAVLLFKSLKLTALMLSSGATFALLILAIGNGASRLYRRYRTSQP